MMIAYDTRVYTLIMYLPNGNADAGGKFTDHDSALRIQTPLTREVLVATVAQYRNAATRLNWRYTILRDAIELDAKEKMRVFYDADDYSRFENI